MQKECSHYHSIKSPFVLCRYERGPCRECRGASQRVKGASQRVKRGLKNSEEGPHEEGQGLVKMEGLVKKGGLADDVASCGRNVT